MKQKNAGKKVVTAKKRAARRDPTVGKRIVEGLEQAVAWTGGEIDQVRVTLVQVPEIDVRKVRQGMGLSQAQFATKFGFPPAMLRNWEQGRSGRTRHPEAVEEVLGKAS